MTPADLAALVRAALAAVTADVPGGVQHGRGLPADALTVDVELARPRDPARGDFATPVALRAAKKVGVAPLVLAEWLAADLATRAGIAAAEVAGPGFVNVRLAGAARGALVGAVLAAGESYGTGSELAGQCRAAPLAVGPVRPAALSNARAEVVTEALARLRAARGAAPPVAAAGHGAGPEVPPEVRYALLRVPPAAGLHVDLGLLATPIDANPGYRVRFAHASLAALCRQAADLGMAPGTRYELLEHPELIGELASFPDAVRTAARTGQPDRVARYLDSLITTYHRFADAHRVLPRGDEPVTELLRARLALCAATRQVLGNGLRLLGVEAPERL